MKNHRRPHLVCVLLVAGTLIALTGCAKRGYHAGERTATNLQTLATRIEAAGRQMDIAVTELDGLVTNPQPDLRPQFDRFAAAVGQLNSLATNIARADTQLQARGKLHLQNWDQDIAAIQNESIRASAEARKQEVTSRFDSVHNSCLSVQTALAPVQADLRDLQRYLNADLTMGGLASIKDTAMRVGRNAAPAREAVAKLVNELRDLGVAMAPQNSAAPAGTK
jgi:SMC interacting uncharacterized protein involved in chromosome segregation